MTLRRRILESLRYQGPHGGLEISTVLTDAYGYSADSKNGVLTLYHQSHQLELQRRIYGRLAHIPLYLDCTYLFSDLYISSRVSQLEITESTLD